MGEELFIGYWVSWPRWVLWVVDGDKSSMIVLNTHYILKIVKMVSPMLCVFITIKKFYFRCVSFSCYLTNNAETASGKLLSSDYTKNLCTVYHRFLMKFSVLIQTYYQVWYFLKYSFTLLENSTNYIHIVIFPFKHLFSRKLQELPKVRKQVAGPIEIVKKVVRKVCLCIRKF